MDELAASLPIEEEVLAPLPVFFVEEELIYQIGVIFQLGIHNFNIMFKLPKQKS